MRMAIIFGSIAGTGGPSATSSCFAPGSPALEPFVPSRGWCYSVHPAIPDSVRCYRSSAEDATSLMKAVFVEQHGGPENLKYAELPKPAPGPGQALVKIAACGVNFIDVYFRTGLYPAPPPVVLGNEAAGTVEAVGPDVTERAVGDSVAYAMARGSYAEYAVLPAWHVVRIPDAVDFPTAPAAMLQRLTPRFLNPPPCPPD